MPALRCELTQLSARVFTRPLNHRAAGKEIPNSNPEFCCAAAHPRERFGRNPLMAPSYPKSDGLRICFAGNAVSFSRVGRRTGTKRPGLTARRCCNLFVINERPEWTTSCCLAGRMTTCEWIYVQSSQTVHALEHAHTLREREFLAHRLQELQGRVRFEQRRLVSAGIYNPDSSPSWSSFDETPVRDRWP